MTVLENDFVSIVSCGVRRPEAEQGRVQENQEEAGLLETRGRFWGKFIWGRISLWSCVK